MSSLAYIRMAVSALLAATLGFAGPPALAATDAQDGNTQTPIQHVIVVIGSGHSFDHLFATYVPRSGKVSNLLAKGIVNADGTLGVQAAALHEPALAAGVMNMQGGDLPYFRSLADQYMLADNYHQAATSGSFANSMMLGYGDATTLKPGSAPAKLRSIADVLMQARVSWAYYGEGWGRRPADPDNLYCAPCNPFQYQSSVMEHAAVRNRVLKDTIALDADIRDDAMPAVAFVRPGLHDDGRGDIARFEAFARHVVTSVQAHRNLWATTAILITMDDAGATYDAGYTQTIDAAGDGERVPLLIVSPFTVNQGVHHNYADHGSVLKFIEANWGLGPIGPHTRDTLPNPIVSVGQLYVPINIPAIGDLMDFFGFPEQD